MRDVHVDLTFGGLMAHGIVSLKPLYPGHAKNIGRLVADSTTLKRVTVVDEDIDIRDHMHMAWAMNSRFSPARDTIIIEDVFAPRGMDPTLRVRDDMAEFSSKLGCDATQEGDKGTFSLPSRELMTDALETWTEVGLPDFEIPKRIQFMLDRS